MATIPNQNTADRLSDVIDEGDAIIHHIRITILALHDSRAVRSCEEITRAFDRSAGYGSGGAAVRV
jgi:hypothetical protein